MSEVIYDGSVVNDVVLQISDLQNRFTSLSSDIKTATNKIVSARGYNEYIGGIDSDSFSSYVEQCGAVVGELVCIIRQKQIDILAYSGDEKEINLFLDTLSNKDYKTLDLSRLDQYMSFGRKAGNFFKGLFADTATVGLGLLEGGLDFLETGADLIKLGDTIGCSIFTGVYDLVTGDNLTERMWEETKAEVAEKKVESLFNSFYSDTALGRSIKDNFSLSLPVVGDISFDTVRGISKGVGYSAAMIGFNVVTGGLASGVAIGTQGSVTAAQLATTAGLMGFSNGTEEAWADDATIISGLGYGVASGVWDAVQWYAGAKINQIGGLGDRVAKGIFKGAVSGVGTRITMDALDSGLEGFVKPGFTMIYKDYGGSNFSENYWKAFNAAGGWGNVASQVAIGAFTSAISEFTGARKLLKEDQKQAELEKARELFVSQLEESDRIAATKDLAALAGGDGSSAVFESFGTKGEYGVDQGVFSKLIMNERVNNDWLGSEEELTAFIAKKYPNESKEWIQDSVNNLVNSSEITDFGKDVVIEYISQSTDSYDEAFRIFNDSFTPKKAAYYDKIVGKYTSMGLSEADAVGLLKRIDQVGACSYASQANGIVSYFSDKPELFKETFGFDLFREVDGKKVVNAEELLADLYVYANTVGNTIPRGSTTTGAQLFEVNDGKLTILSTDASKQVYMSGRLWTRDDVMKSYLKSKSPNFDFTDDMTSYFDKETFVFGNSNNLTEDGFRSTIQGLFDDGYNVELGIYRGDKTMFTFYNTDGTINVTTNSWKEGGGHAVFVTGLTDTDVVVSSWGDRLTIPIKDFIGNNFNLIWSKISG